MNFDDYQDEARRTASNEGDKIAIFALGLCGEAGEVADLIKKFRGHGHDLDKAKVTKELGDVLWYVSNLADQLGISLDVVAQTNMAKLRARYPNGFSVEASKVKADEFMAVLTKPVESGDPVFSNMIVTGRLSVNAGLNVEPRKLPEPSDLTAFTAPEPSDLEALAAREAQPFIPQPHAGSPDVDEGFSLVDGVMYFHGKALTCNTCKVEECPYRWDGYNTDGDCLAEK